MATAIDRRSFLARSAATAGGVVTAGTLADLAMAETAGATTFSGTLRVGLLDLPTGGVGPAWGKMDSAGFSIMRAIYDPLFVIDSTGVPRGFLAESGTPSKDYKSWTIKLRSGIKFHDGSDLNADALIANMNGWINPNAIAHYAVAPLIQPKGSSVAATTKVDNLTVTVKLNYPWVSFLNTLAEQQIAYVQSVGCINANKAKGGDGDKAPVGTGPFIFSSCDWLEASVFKANHNPNYWIAGLPNVDKIEFHPIVDGVSRVAAPTNPRHPRLICGSGPPKNWRFGGQFSAYWLHAIAPGTSYLRPKPRLAAWQARPPTEKNQSLARDFSQSHSGRGLPRWRSSGPVGRLSLDRHRRCARS